MFHAVSTDSYGASPTYGVVPSDSAVTVEVIVQPEQSLMHNSWLQLAWSPMENTDDTEHDAAWRHLHDSAGQP